MGLPEITLGVLSSYYLLSEQLKEVLWYTGGKELGTLWDSVSISSYPINLAA